MLIDVASNSPMTDTVRGAAEKEGLGKYVFEMVFETSTSTH